MVHARPLILNQALCFVTGFLGKACNRQRHSILPRSQGFPCSVHCQTISLAHMGLNICMVDQSPLPQSSSVEPQRTICRTLPQKRGITSCLPHFNELRPTMLCVLVVLIIQQEMQSKVEKVLQLQIKCIHLRRNPVSTAIFHSFRIHSSHRPESNKLHYQKVQFQNVDTEALKHRKATPGHMCFKLP